ncbi:MAG TPA: thioredoxin domain-containing protein [Elusimicrobiota bacterium]|nr:thioredoxin domain-containing protein [Elusimicrobiota bacterium]
MAANRLAAEISPYLIHHADNPVDWYPWGPEAFARAKREDKPVFLSVGYSACHWCHVMERESFQNGSIAAVLNEHFVCIKVDREERPDVDEFYMASVQLFAGRGGWPMTVFLTPDGEPFFGGTYFPPENRAGQAGLKELLEGIARAYRDERPRIRTGAAAIVAQLKKNFRPAAPGRPLSSHGIERAGRELLLQKDPLHGGFGDAPKFPRSSDLQFLMRYWRKSGDRDALSHVQLTLDKMAAGGIYDHLAGGFHRYSVHSDWSAPHFEKMLYDNALLPRAYLDAYQAAPHPRHARVVRETLEYVLREMSDPAGGFHSSQDADSEGREGSYYLWTLREIHDVLGPEDGPLAGDYFNVRAGGNFEAGQNVLRITETDNAFCARHRIDPLLWPERRRSFCRKLLEIREKRVKPDKDDKIITAWNGLMIGTLARAGRILQERSYETAATRAAYFLLNNMFHEGRLFRAWRGGQAKWKAPLEDYAFLAAGLLDLYEATGQTRWAKEALVLNNVMLKLFWDKTQGGFFFVGEDENGAPDRLKTAGDGVLPSPNAVAAMNLLRLHELTLDPELREMAHKTLRLFSGDSGRAGIGDPSLLAALDFHLEPPLSIVLAGEPREADRHPFLEPLEAAYFPNKALSFAHAGEEAEEKLFPLLKDKRPVDGKPTAYVCQNAACSAPITTVQALLARLQEK